MASAAQLTGWMGWQEPRFRGSTNRPARMFLAGTAGSPC